LRFDSGEGSPADEVGFGAVDALERWTRAGLELAGQEVSDVDLAVIRAADAAYGPELRALAAADLSDVLPETDLDPARPPRPL
jgi:hypothetical protein